MNASSESTRSITPVPGGRKCDVPGEHRELRLRHTGQIAEHAAATRLEQLYRVLEPR
jgi:hypothetical protein